MTNITSTCKDIAPTTGELAVLSIDDLDEAAGGKGKTSGGGGSGGGGGGGGGTTVTGGGQVRTCTPLPGGTHQVCVTVEIVPK